VNDAGPVLRDATARDAEVIAALHADSWRRNYRGAFPDAYLDSEVFADRRAVWTERLREPRAGAFTIVAELDGRVVGFAHTILDADEELGALVDNLHVTHDRKREGIGARLMADSARRVTERRPGSGLYLEVLEQNAAAQAFYEARGGTRVGPSQEVPVEGGGTAFCFVYAWTIETLDRLA
jgi:ribosomal protein S18 acetylase RimI-like enzyme